MKLPGKLSSNESNEENIGGSPTDVLQVAGTVVLGGEEPCFHVGATCLGGGCGCIPTSSKFGKPFVTPGVDHQESCEAGGSRSCWRSPESCGGGPTNE